MWTCIRCNAELSPEDAPPDIDDFGVHFICPHCGRRNRLINVGAGDETVLRQVDSPEP